MVLIESKGIRKLTLGNDDDGSEDLLLDNPHVRLDVSEDGRLDEVSKKQNTGVRKKQRVKEKRKRMLTPQFRDGHLQREQ